MRYFVYIGLLGLCVWLFLDFPLSYSLYCDFRGENLDAYLGDYPILDYARVKLDPECDLRILTQTFGEDGYGIGLPKGSPLKVLSCSVLLFAVQ